MSGTQTPTSEGSAGSRTRVTRTVAIIKNHALARRMEIEERIQKAGFEIVKERQMEFAQNSDQEFLRELFGKDVPSLFQGPVWVYVLERRRAVELFNALMGEEDPSLARKTSPNSIRALFGRDEAQNAIMGSPSTEIAEVQIQCLFQSSPPFSTQDPEGTDAIIDDIHHELGNDGATENGTNGTMSDDWQNRESMLSPTSSQLSRSANGSRFAGFSSALSNTSSKSPNGKVQFRARPLPKTHEAPDIMPRMSRAAALRAGIDLGRHDRPRVAPTKEEMKQAFMDVPGHKRSTTIQVASTAPPVIAPRMTKAAALRLGQAAPTATPGPKSRPSTAGATAKRGNNKAIFEGVPGHKRRETIQVASVQAPTVSPRLNKSAALRAKKDSAPPVSFMFRPPTAPKAPGTLSRSNSQTGSTSSRPGSALSRSTSSLANRQPASNATSQKPLNGASSSGSSSQDDMAEITARMRSMPTRPPSIEPRTNRSALLRAKAGGPTPPVKQVPVVNRRASMII
ncbi:hypothetical protein ACEPAF_9782 [Sanghuangporus sanghuang]